MNSSIITIGQHSAIPFIMGFLFVIFMIFSSVAMATQTDNHGLHAVPPPDGKVTIDGDLKDWDLSGQIFICYDVDTLKDVYSAKVAAMYDAKNLYVSLHWKDTSPMGNIHDPRYQSNKGWAGDSVQFRVKTDRVSWITAWHYAAKKESCMLIDYPKNLNPEGADGSRIFQTTEGWKLNDGVEMAFKKDADGKGYVQEMLIPWEYITIKKNYKAGEKFQMGIELLWGEVDWPVHRYADNLADGATSREFFWTAINSWGDVVLEPKGNLNLPAPAWMKESALDIPVGPVDIKYSLPADSRVTIAIEDKNGKRIRNLIASADRKKGDNVEKWDGLDDNGKAVATGEYKFKGIFHDGIHVNYAMSFGNPGNPSWDTSDSRGAFYGDHTAAHAAAAAGNYIALACPMGEGGKYLIGLDLTGQRLWGLANRVAFDGGRASLATDGKLLWISNQGKEASIYRVDIATGKYAPWKRMAKDVAGNEAPMLDLQVSDFKKEQTNDTLPVGIGGEGKKAEFNMTAIALNKGLLAIALNLENIVKVIDAENGDVKAEIKIKSPISVTGYGNGWLVLAEGKIISVSADGKTTPFTKETYPDGYSIVSDTKGNVYLSVRGTEQNIKIFSSKGKFAGEIGKRGGRPNHGAFIAEAMREPGQIAIDGLGRLWVTEETMNPKRTSLWDVKKKKLIKDFVGTGTYSGTGSINPFDSTMAFANNTVYKIDLLKGTWKPVYSIGAGNNPDEIFPPRIHDYVTCKTIKRDGKYYATTGGSARASNEIEVVAWDGKNWRSVANIGIVPKVNKPADLVGDWTKFRHPFFTGKEGQLYAWVDQNGDGIVQKEELTFINPTADGKPITLRSYYWGQLPDDDGTITYMVSGGNALYRIPISSINKSGAPVYDLSKAYVVKVDQPVLEKGNGEGMIIGGKDGMVYINQDPLITVDKTGHVIGGYPNRHTSVHGSHTAKASTPGYLIGPSSFMGVADMGGNTGEIFDLNGNLGENYLFTNDGLWVQSLFKDCRGWYETPSKAIRGMSMDAITAGGESFGGNFIKASNGKVYLTIGGTDARVLEVKGLDTIKRFNGEFSYTPAQYDAAQKLLLDKAIQVNQPKVYQITKATVPIIIDGNSAKWAELMDDSKSLIEVQESKQQRYGRVQARYDADNLYLAYRVFIKRSQMSNVGQDYRLLFKSGDVVDLMIGPDPQKAKGEGNSRIILTPFSGKMIAVLNQKYVPGAAKSEGFGFASPARSIQFDRVIVTTDVKIATSPINGGYFVETAIPWKTIGITPKSGLKLKADIGILYGDAGGTVTVARNYWSNKATNLVNDIPGEGDLQPELWGSFTLE